MKEQIKHELMQSNQARLISAHSLLTRGTPWIYALAWQTSKDGKCSFSHSQSV